MCLILLWLTLVSALLSIFSSLLAIFVWKSDLDHHLRNENEISSTPAGFSPLHNIVKSRDQDYDDNLM